jgi:hypothetical protein
MAGTQSPVLPELISRQGLGLESKIHTQLESIVEPA